MTDRDSTMTTDKRESITVSIEDADVDPTIIAHACRGCGVWIESGVEKDYCDACQKRLFPVDYSPVIDDELAESERLANGADAGPWIGSNEALDHLRNQSGRSIAVFSWKTSSTSDFAQMIANRDFVAHARTMLPRYVAEIRRLRAKQSDLTLLNKLEASREDFRREQRVSMELADKLKDAERDRDKYKASAPSLSEFADAMWRKHERITTELENLEKGE